MTNYSTLTPRCRSALGFGEPEEATGLLQRVALLGRRLTLKFDWGTVYITLDANEAESAYQALNGHVGSKVGVLLLIDDSGSSILRVREVRK